jgi:serine/threonine protein phosphatase PrpC
MGSDIPNRDADGAVQPPPFDVGAASHPGKVRRVNEDSFFVAPASGVFAVADGMGGHEAGDVASQTIVRCLGSIGLPVSAADLLARLEDRILRANAALQEIARDRGRTLGSTVAILLVYEDHFACVWSGDSRIYRVRGGAIAQLSRDHTEVRDLMDRGLLTAEEARTWPRKNVITRAIGVREEPELELEHGTLEPGDLFVICSDGLTGHVEDAEILERAAAAGSQAVSDALVALTLERGASDNVTVVVVRYLAKAAAAGRAGSDTVVLNRAARREVVAGQETIP